ncbi:MAG: hypothetical protein JWL88_22 [Parcubacteria group bacterium]|nr:hypothetical protein [Parcubacteria group bacterium]
MPVPTSLLVASHAEVASAVEQGFLFPAMAIPFGAHDTTPCRFFISSDDVTCEDIAALIESSYPMQDGVRRLHLITAPRTGISHFNPGSKFYLVQT